MYLKFLLATILLFYFSTFGFSQGCSDAGVCSTGALNPVNDNVTKTSVVNKFAVTYSAYYQHYKHDFKDYGVGLSFDYYLSERSTLQAKGLYSIKESVLTTTQGIGDITLSYSYQFFKNSIWSGNVVVGGKIPTNDANLELDGRPLPMFYQTSLGTYDALIGVSFYTKNWHFSVGYQHPLNALDNHEYDPFYWRDHPRADWIANRYESTRHLDRKMDVSARLKYTIKTSKWSIAPSVLGIYKLEKGYVESIENGNYLVDGSEGLTINTLIEGSYYFSPHLSITLLGAYAAQQRPKNPDALNRDYVFNLFIKHQF
ncbi:hypothetical protein KMW28_09335 [Flammeovirga yaeyamensis]|uniref:Transporter n=1 Tax=Flammeovirga yaeyamensis TaxID=367791 RepID=A0AAX1N890_9BACT|nr:hypothetical protein [Flammeovirga yaeyamensis]MBB3698838.1 hypothetical protein [Flammeovirga yaeyamensis]NMF37423.1 hypothetical protein [Flammeovirga yaeyamensis]QWG03764.1 hypothetical protein KMW28_09335 [Flammeovirga yaeyamensis]